jgi:hypothetical protein
LPVHSGATQTTFQPKSDFSLGIFPKIADDFFRLASWRLTKYHRPLSREQKQNRIAGKGIIHAP